MNSGKICVSICGETADEMIAGVEQARPYADVIELRFDCLPQDEIGKLYELAGGSDPDIPFIATFRSPDQGGQNAITHSMRAAFWARPQNGFWAADVEEDILDLTEHWRRRIVSFHDLDGSGADVKGIGNRLSTIGGEIVKIAVNAPDITDALGIWHLLKEKGADQNLIPVAMGEAGKWTRILGPAHGAFITYGSVALGRETAPGQITAKDLAETYRVKELDLDTAVYGVIGDPVSRSLSPYMHNPCFAAAGINAVFLPLAVTDLEAFIRRMVAPKTREAELNFCGFSVTMPHKRSVIGHLDQIDPVARTIGAVNTIAVSDGRLIGHNTDAAGFIEPLLARFGSVRDARVTVFGAGGAARACLFALKAEGAVVTVAARDEKRSASLAEEFDVRSAPLDSAAGGAEIVVNATPLGMAGPDENRSIIRANELNGVKFVYDLVTRPADTPIMKEAALAGVEAIGGLEMLIAQGERQFEIWTGRKAPAGLMRASALAHSK